MMPKQKATTTVPEVISDRLAEHVEIVSNEHGGVDMFLDGAAFPWLTAAPGPVVTFDVQEGVHYVTVRIPALRVSANVDGTRKPWGAIPCQPGCAKEPVAGGKWTCRAEGCPTAL